MKSGKTLAKKKTLLIIALLLAVVMASMFVFTACSNTNNNTDDTVVDGGGDNGDDNGGDDNGDDLPSTQTYSHVFNQKDFADGIGGGKTNLINGLEWQYGAITFLGQSSNGVQIGSNKKPQSTPLTLYAIFPGEVELTSFCVKVCSNAQGNVKVSTDDYAYEGVASGNVLMDIAQSGLNEKTQTLTLTLQSSAKAIYFYSLEFQVSVPKDINLQLATDEGNVTAVKPGEDGVPNVNYALTTKEAYYNGLDLTLTGDALRQELNGKISNMTRISYGDDTQIMRYTDESVEKPGYDYGFYDGDFLLAQANGTWNKEHVWACSRMKLDGKDPRPDSGTKNHATDIHNLRITCQDTNGKHGNKFYDDEESALNFFPNITGLSSNHRCKGDFRGDVARIIFYMYARYDFLNIVEDVNEGLSLHMGRYSTLLKWNREDPVDEFEIQRNNRIFEYQGNRNPFIDYPDLVNKILSVEALAQIDESALDLQSASNEPSPVESKSASDGEISVVVMKFDCDIVSVKKTRCERLAA